MNLDRLREELRRIGSFRVLAIDPGTNTGLAYGWYDRTARRVTVKNDLDVRRGDVYSWIDTFMSTDLPKCCVVEDMPGMLRSDMYKSFAQNVVDNVETYTPLVTLVGPGIWKPWFTPYKRMSVANIVEPYGLCAHEPATMGEYRRTAHQKDAMGLLLWFLIHVCPR